MDVIETAIRNAFEKGDASDRAFREKVYRSAFAALDRALNANPNLTVQTAIGRRKSLQAKIAEIESEFVPARAPVVTPTASAAAGQPGYATERPRPPGDRPAAPAVAPPVSSAAAERPAAPEIRADVGMGAPRNQAPEPRLDDGLRPAEPALDHTPRLDPERERRAPQTVAEAEIPAQRERVVDGQRRRPFAAMFVVVTLVTALGAGLWWAYSTGLFKSAAEIDTSVPNPPATAEEEDFDPDEEPIASPVSPGAADAERDWIGIFSPDDPALVSAPSGTTAEVMQDDTGNFIRIRSSGVDTAVAFDVGQGVLEQLAGRRAIFNIVARAEEGSETQISVSCNFGELGGCGRKRYAVGYEKGDLLFEIQFPDKRPGAGGTIAVISDIAGSGKALDIYEIRASVAQ